MNESLAHSDLINRLVAMNSPDRKWTLVVIRDGKRTEAVNLCQGITTIGRDQSNDIVLPDSSVSRHHAEIVCEPEGVRVRDLKSHNGIKVNGVPRQEACLQPGDRLEISMFAFELGPACSGTTAMLSLEQAIEHAAKQEQTIDDRIRLPEPRQERQLATLYHVCFWVAEGVDQNAFVPRCLRLLMESLQVQEVHLYSADLQLEASATANNAKPSIKLAGFLARKYQEASEASIILGRDIAQHQQRVGQYNYLVGPLRAKQATPHESGFVVLVRPTEWSDFAAEDRVLLQAVCQLWSRGLAKACQVQELRQENASLRQRVNLPLLLGSSAIMDKLRAQATKAAAVNLTVLLQGETGSGKEVVAQLIHETSARQSGPFIKVNCAAIPEGLLESELFGHVKGAFTDARADHIGKFTQADGGTLFLDEIGDMPLVVQAKVLRAIETGEVEPLGAEGITQVNVRIVAATHRDLEDMVRQGRFRQDLFYRLNVLNIAVPPLRAHVEDLDELANVFLEKFCVENGLAAMTFAPDALALLKQHNWAGNVRELRNVVQRCALAAVPPLIKQEDVMEQLPSLKQTSASTAGTG